MLSARLRRRRAVRLDPAISSVVPARTARAFLLLFVTLSTWTSAAAECRVPSYRVGHVWEDTPSSIMANVSIRLSDFVPAQLVCLAESLKRRYTDRKEIDISILSSLDAARRFTMPLIGDWVDRPYVNPTAQLYAKYHRDVDKREEFVMVGPVGNRNPVQRIDLPAVSIPPCMLQVASRCLLAVDRATLEYYPGTAWKAKVSAAITLEGVIDRGGRVQKVKTVGAPTSPNIIENLLLQAARRNLKTWRFEPAHRQDSLRITYDYRVDPSAPSSGIPAFRFDLPHRVEIRVRPIS